MSACMITEEMFLVAKTTERIVYPSGSFDVVGGGGGDLREPEESKED